MGFGGMFVTWLIFHEMEEIRTDQLYYFCHVQKFDSI